VVSLIFFKFFLKLKWYISFIKK